jgi:branched-chain amino acid transport system substrate-binding protein
MRSQKVVLLVMVLIAALLIAQCTAQPTPAPQQPAAPEEPVVVQPPAQQKVFKLGVLGPFTGPSARTGAEFRASAELAMEKIDYTIGDYKIELVWVDSQSDPERATRAYEEAIVQGGIQAGILNWHSSVAVALMDVVAKHKVPHFFGYGATEVVNEKFESDPAKYAYWSIKGWASPEKLSQNYVTAIEDAIAAGTWTPDAKRAAIYGEDTDWGRSFGDGIARQLQAVGWEIVDRQYFPLDQTEFYPLLNKFKDQNLALIAGTSTAPPSLSAFIKQADEIGLKSLIIADGLGWVGEWYDLTGSSSNYVLDQIPGWTSEASYRFADEFEQKTNMVPSPSSAGLAYDGTNFFIKLAQATIEAHGELSSETIQKVVEGKLWTGELTFTSADGAIVMAEYNYSDPPDPLVGKGYYTFPVLQYMNGEGLYIWPPEFQNADLAGKP